MKALMNSRYDNILTVASERKESQRFGVDQRRVVKRVYNRLMSTLDNSRSVSYLTFVDIVTVWCRNMTVSEAWKEHRDNEDGRWKRDCRLPVSTDESASRLAIVLALCPKCSIYFSTAA